MEPFIIKGVEANYPKIDQPYHFSQKENRSVACDAHAENAAYELNVRLTPEQTSELWAKMQAAWQEGRDESWPESIEPSFKKDGDLYEVKTRRKASYGPPLQRFADNSEAPADFKLTSGSIVNVAVQFVPYKMRDHGVALAPYGCAGYSNTLSSSHRHRSTQLMATPAAPPHLPTIRLRNLTLPRLSNHQATLVFRGSACGTS